MFTGIIQEIGTVVEVRSGGANRRLVIDAPGVASALEPGDSVAVDGVCQTVLRAGAGRFDVEAVPTTLSRTTLGALGAGDRVNIESALALGDKLGGHLVQGHVDAVGEVTESAKRAGHVLLTVRAAAVVTEVTPLHGSIAIQGVSLTVNARPGPDLVQVALIPYTLEHTTLSALRPGDRVNLEGDMLGRFVTDYLKRTGASGV
jgi:riboflavin synthase